MNNGGFAGLAKSLGQAGRAGDTKVGTVTPSAQAFLKMAGGSGTTNPWTGLTEYAREDNFDAEWYLSQNPDVADAGVDAWEHYNTFGKSEGRLGNETEYKIRTEENYGGPFDGNGAYTTWRTNRLNEIGALDDSGAIRSDLQGGNVDVNAAGSLDDLIARIDLRDNKKYLGQWGAGGAGRFMENYSDADGDGTWTAANDSNINRYGEDVSAQRDLFRDIGYDLDWGSGGAQDFWSTFLAENPDFDGGIGDAQQYLADKAEGEAQASFADQMESFLESLFGGLNDQRQQQQESQTSAIEDLLAGILGSGNQSATPDVYGATPPAARQVNSGAFGNMRAVFNPMTGRTEWVPVNSFGGFANAFTGESGVSSSTNSGRRSGFGSLIMV